VLAAVAQLIAVTKGVLLSMVISPIFQKLKFAGTNGPAYLRFRGQGKKIQSSSSTRVKEGIASQTGC
jgi:hypothetical protein